MPKTEQQANGKRSWALLGSALHGPRYLLVLFSATCFALHGPRYLFVLSSVAYFACTALVIFWLSFRTSWDPLGSLPDAKSCLKALGDDVGAKMLPRRPPGPSKIMLPSRRELDFHKIEGSRKVTEKELQNEPPESLLEPLGASS